MDRQSFTDLIQTKFKMVRIEALYSRYNGTNHWTFQKTLVQIEKKEFYQTGLHAYQFVLYSEIQMY